MKSFFKELFQYSHSCNQKLYELFREHQDKTPEKSVNLFNHILYAHHIWNNRIESKQPVFDPWKMPALDGLRDMDTANFEQSLQILDQCDLDEMVRYTNTKGESFANKVRDILFHVINHSTYHRGQIAIEFRGHGLEPLVSDYIFYKRKG